MSTASKKKIDIAYVVKTIICLWLLFGFGTLTPWGNLEPIGMKVLGIFLGMLFGWTFIGFIWPSILGCIALGFSGYASVGSIISAGIGNISVTVFVLFLFIMAGYVDKVGLTAWIAHWFISRKIAINRPWVLTSLMFLCIYVLGGFISVFAGIFLMWNIFYKMCEITGYKPYDKYSVYVIVGIVFCGTLGFAVFPFKAVQVMALGALQTACDGAVAVNLGSFTLLNIIMSLCCLVLYVAVGKYILRIDVSLLQNRGDMFEHLRGQKLTKEQIVAAIFLFYFFFGMFAPSFLPKTNVVAQFFSKLGLTGTLLLGLGVLSIVRIDGKSPIDFGKAAGSIQWDIIIMFIATMPISSAMSSGDTGVIKFVVQLVTPIFGNMSATFFAVMFIVVMAVLTQFTHNLVLAAMVPSILYGFCVQLGVTNIALLVTLFTFAISIAIATPGGSTMSALIFANTEWVDMKTAYLFSCIAAIISLIVVLAVGFPIGALIF